MGINVEEVEEASKSEEVLAKCLQIREMYPNKKIIMGRDKLD